jgi:hypothetical protein
MITVGWGTDKVIRIPKADLTLIGGTLYELDTDALRLVLKALEDDPAEGMIWPDTHRHNPEVTVAGVTYSRTIEIINGYSIEFEDGQYTVRLVGSNNNFFDVQGGILVQNQVQVIPTNAAGLITVSTSGADPTAIASAVWARSAALHEAEGTMGGALNLARAILRNRTVTDPDTGLMTVYDDDGVTPLLVAELYEDVAGAQPYRGKGADRRERLT